MKSNDRCSIKRCRQPTAMFYYDKCVCQMCWEKHCDLKMDLKLELKIKGGVKDV